MGFTGRPVLGRNRMEVRVGVEVRGEWCGG